MASGGNDPTDKTSRASTFGASLLNKLPSASRKQRKRLTDKKRRQAMKKEVSASETG